MQGILFSPPVVFIILLFTILIFSWFCSKARFRKKEERLEAKKAYACGEDFQDHMIQPDYSQFFPFAFFFTILHVVALMVATVPVEDIKVFAIALVYVIGAIMGLIILLRK